MEATERMEFNYKLVILGYYSVGKSSLALKYVKNQFNVNEESTIGAAFLTKTIFYQDHTIKYEIWDTAGQERYRSLIPMYYRGAHVALIVYDITSIESFETAKMWFEELNTEKPNNFLKVLVGNKKDLERQSRRVSAAEAEDFAISNGIKFYEVSAKTGENVENLFNDIAAVLPKIQKKKKKVSVMNLKGNNKYNCC